MNSTYMTIAVLLIALSSACSVRSKETQNMLAPTPPNASFSSSNGGVDGGGGNAVVCRDPSGTLVSAEMLDLFEAKTMFGLNVQKSTNPYEAQIKQITAKVPDHSRILINVFVSQVIKAMKIVPAVQLKTINDSFEVLWPKGCAAEQLANYVNNQLVLVNGDVWSALSETDRAALVLHEAIYAANRMVGAKDSRRSRHAVGSLFDPSTQWTDVLNQVPTDALGCASSAIPLAMWTYKNAAGEWLLQFQILGGAYVFSQKTTTLSGQPAIDFSEAKDFPISQGEDRIGESTTLFLQLRSAFEDGDSIAIKKRWEPLKDSQGQIIHGYQTPRYYLDWQSATYPGLSFMDAPLNCSIKYTTTAN